MGDYSSVCAVSGLPITGDNQIVGFEVEKYLWADEAPAKHQFVPASWPVFGQYDDMGGIEDEPLSPNCALIHKSIWDNAHLYWHKENTPYSKNWLNVEAALEKSKKEQENLKFFDSECRRRYRTWTPADFLYDEIRNQLSISHTCFGLTFRDLIDGKDFTGHGTGLLFLRRGRFMEIILQKMLIPEGWTEQDQQILDKLICLFCGQMLTGKPIMPSNISRVEQYPRYEQRIEILEFQLALLKKLKADRDKD